jgi:hypothetical protein
MVDMWVDIRAMRKEELHGGDLAVSSGACER